MTDAAAHAYRTLDVAVRGGDLRVGVWEPGAEPVATVLAVHGVTASHLAWPFLVEALPGVRVIAPDLRGRGASAGLPGPAGMAAHADDLAAALDAAGVDRAIVVGHSMGAFVSVVFAHRHPDRVARLILVDGGLPLDVPAELTPDEVIRHVLGPTAERLAMRFATVDDYLDFWRAHPAFANDWTPELERYLAYDLVGEAPELRPATSYATLAEDSIDQNTGTALAGALACLPPGTVLLTAERGLLDQRPALYAAERLPTLLSEYPALRHVPVAGVNHYTIVMSQQGADAVAAVVREESFTAPRP
ncbi:alpha/beta fold hydrolase [Microbacterium sp. BWT-B31]|uniref:alpha/beta hydrolase n=1 Tax=Microbacterium sp. BWT-B31 TaxID=3232072 RepID=UPI0035289E21